MATAAQSARRESRWIELSDFTPGIFGDYHAGGGSGSRAAVLHDGAATVENTYRCVSDPTGGLIPLPRAVNGNQNVGYPSFTFHPTWPGMYVLDAISVPWGNVSEGGAASVPLQQLTRLFVLYGMIVSTTGTDPYYKVILCRMYDGFAVNTKDILWESSNGTATYLQANVSVAMQGGNLLSLLTSANSHNPPVVQSDLITAIGGCVWMPVDHAAAAIVAGETPQTTFDADVSVNYPTGVAVGTEYAAGFPWMYPNPTTLNTVFIPITDVAAVLGGYRYAVNHQGRFVALAWQPRASGTVIGSSILDVVYYNPPLDAQSLVFSTGSGSLAPADDNLTGPVSFGVSVSADELLLVRENGGGVLIRGDLDNPTIQKLPGLESTGGVTAVPASTPAGTIYGSRNGVFSWSGGDTAIKLSRQLDGFFWDASGGKAFSGNRGRFSYWHPYVLAPNNWVFDTRTQSWWRLDSTGTLTFGAYAVNGEKNVMYAFPWRHTSNAVAWQEFSQDVLTTSWSWQSQPLVDTLDRRVATSELGIVVSPGTNVNTNQSVAVTVTAYSDAGVASTATKTFTFSGVNGAQPLVLRGDLSAEVVGRYMQVRFIADGGSGGGNGNAPKLISCRLAVRDNQMPAKV